MPLEPTLTTTSPPPGREGRTVDHLGGSTPAAAISRSRLSSGEQPALSAGILSLTPSHFAYGFGLGASRASGVPVGGSVEAAAGEDHGPRPNALTEATEKR